MDKKQYDTKFNNFLVGTPYEIHSKQEPNILQFREMTNQGKLTEVITVDLYKILFEKFKQEIGENFDLTREFIHSAPPIMVEFDNLFGYTLYALGPCLFVFDSQKSFQLLSGTQIDPNQFISFYLKFDSKITYLKISGKKLVICEKLNVNIYNIENFYISNGRCAPENIIKIQAQIEKGVYVRQISSDENGNFLIILSNFSFFEFHNDNLQQSQTLVRSAIYNQNRDQIIALPYFKDDEVQNPHIHIYQKGSNFLLLKEIKLDFPEESKRNFFRALFINEYIHGTTSIFSTIFENDEDQAENIGMPFIFMINIDLNDKSSIGQLKQTKNAIQYFFYADLQHQSDENNSIPITKLLSLCKPNSKDDIDVLILFMNHQYKPFIFLKEFDNTIKYCEWQNSRHTPSISYPSKTDKEGNQIYSQETECLGTTLGGFIVSSFIDNSMKGQYQMKLQSDDNEEDSQWCFPPFFTIYGLDGKLYVYQIYVKQFYDISILTELDQPQQQQLSNNQQQNINQNRNQVHNQNSQFQEEEKKQESFIYDQNQSKASQQNLNFNVQAKNQINPFLSSLIQDSQTNIFQNKLVKDTTNLKDIQKIQKYNEIQQKINLDDEYGKETDEKIVIKQKEEKKQIDILINIQQDNQQEDGQIIENNQQNLENNSKYKQNLVKQKIIEFERNHQKQSVKNDREKEFEDQKYDVEQINPQYQKKREIEIGEREIRASYLFEMQCNESDHEVFDADTRKSFEDNYIIYRQNVIELKRSQHIQQVKKFAFQQKNINENENKLMRFNEQYNRKIDNEIDMSSQSQDFEEDDVKKSMVYYILDIEKDFTSKYNSKVIKYIAEFKNQIQKDLKELPIINEIKNKNNDESKQIKEKLLRQKKDLQDLGSKKQALYLMEQEMKKGIKLSANDFQIDFLLTNKSNLNDYIISLLESLEKEKIKIVEKSRDQDSNQLVLQQKEIQVFDFQKLKSIIIKLKQYEKDRDLIRIKAKCFEQILKIFKNKLKEEKIADQMTLNQTQEDISEYIEKQKQFKQQSIQDQLSVNISNLKPLNQKEHKLFDQVTKILNKNYQIQGIFIQEINKNIEKRLQKLSYKLKQKQNQEKVESNELNELNESKYGDLFLEGQSLNGSFISEKKSKQSLNDSKITFESLKNIKQTDKYFEMKQRAQLKRIQFLKKYQQSNFQLQCEEIQLQKILKQCNEQQDISQFSQELQNLSFKELQKQKEKIKLNVNEVKNSIINLATINQIQMVEEQKQEPKVQNYELKKQTDQNQSVSLKSRLVLKFNQFVQEEKQKVEEQVKLGEQQLNSLNINQQENQKSPSFQVDQTKNLFNELPKPNQEENKNQNQEADQINKNINPNPLKRQAQFSLTNPLQDKNEKLDQKIPSQFSLDNLNLNLQNDLNPLKESKIQSPKIQNQQEQVNQSQTQIAQVQTQNVLQEQQPQLFQSKLQKQDESSKPNELINKNESKKEEPIQKQNPFQLGFGQSSNLFNQNTSFQTNSFGGISASQLAQSHAQSNQTNQSLNTFGSNINTNLPQFSSIKQQLPIQSNQNQSLFQLQNPVHQQQQQQQQQVPGFFFSGQQKPFQQQTFQPQQFGSQQAGFLSQHQNFPIFESQDKFADDNKNLQFSQPLNLQSNQNQFSGNAFHKSRK